MGKTKRGYNWKARQPNNQTEPNNEEETHEIKKIKIDLDVKPDKFDSSNQLVLPSKSKKAKKFTQQNTTKTVKPLTKKEQKRLRQVLDSKKKKANRAELLEKLKEVQASQADLEQMTSFSEMQTKGLKKHFHQSESKKQISSIKNSRKKGLIGASKLPISKDPNIVGFASEESSELSESEEDEVSETEKVNNKNELNNESVDEISEGDISGKNVTLLENQGNDDKNQPKQSVDEISQDLVGTNVTLLKDNGNDEKNQIKELDKLDETRSNNIERIPAVFIPVDRLPELQEARLKLPILSEEQMIMEAIHDNPVVVICGETGSGKTTQVPQFLYEAGYASTGQMIGITEPRRIAATSMSERVATEMNLNSSKVSYQIRFQGNVTKKTKIKFMTDGVLLKEMQNDFLLTNYSVIIIDEAHERSVYSDILIGLLSRIVPLRNKKNNPLKLIIMSATLRVEDFTQNEHLFKVKPPVIQVDARQYPVTVHFNKRTDDDYVNEAYKKVCKIHRQLPDGGILVFLTGQQEVNELCRKLKRTFPFLGKKKGVCDEPEEIDDKITSKDKRNKKSQKQQILSAQGTGNTNFDNLLPKINLDDYAADPLDEEELQELVNENDDHVENVDTTDEESAEESRFTPSEPLYVLPLFSMLSPQRQAKVFRPAPGKARLCIIATNVAETSLTIPAIKYVIDSGKIKMRHYDKVTGISAFNIQWTSKASADQRAGRAGRTGPGHCYRLYSSAVFVDEFTQFSSAEITRKPVDDLLLQMKALGIDNVVNFPFPSSPEEESLKASERRLINLGALDEPSTLFVDHEKKKWASKITPLGRAMSSFPISPRFAKMLALSHQHNLLPYMIAIVAALTVQEVFVDSQLKGFADGPEDLVVKEKQKKWNHIKQKWAGEGQSLSLGDVMILLKAVGAYEFVGGTQQFCDVHGLHAKAMNEIRKLRLQLTNEVNSAIVNLNLTVDPKMVPPSSTQCKLLRQLILSGMFDRIARKVTEDELAPEDKKRFKGAYKSVEVDSYVFIHPKSVLYKEVPQFVLYQEIFETSKMFMRGVSKVDAEWLPVFAPKLCKFSKPLEDPPPRYDTSGDRILCHINSTYGQHAWPLPCLELDYPEGIERYRWFSSFFLAGQISTALAKYKNVLLASPAVMVKSWARLQARTESMLQAISGEKVDSRKKLFSRWNDNRKYLLDEYLEWLPEYVHYEVKQMWPPKS